MRNDDVLLLDMWIAARRVLQFTAGMTFEQFEQDAKTQSAVIREIQVMGEAARMISHEAKTQHYNIAWAAIAGMRNRVIHEYFNIDVDIVWAVVQDDIPTFVVQLTAILPSEPDE